MTFKKNSRLTLSWLGVIFWRGFALAQVVVPPVPVSVKPVGATPVPVLTGGRYTFELSPGIANGPKPIDLSSKNPSLSFTPLPNTADGAIRREVTVAIDAPPGHTQMQVATDRGEQNVAVVIVPPPPPPEPKVEGHHGEPSDDRKDRDSGTWHLWRWLLVFAVGLALGQVLRRNK